MTFIGPIKNAAPKATDLTIRHAVATDAEAVERLAAYDSSRIPRGDVLVAEVGEEIWAAVSVEDFHAVSDPFRPSGEVVFMLIEHVRQMRRAERGRRTGAGLRLRLRTPRVAAG